MKHVKPFFGILITLTLLDHVQAQDPFTNGLVAYYPFNGSANDASGNGNNGAVNGAVFTATNSIWRSTNYRDVDNWDRLFFRVQVSP